MSGMNGMSSMLPLAGLYMIGERGLVVGCDWMELSVTVLMPCI